MSIAFMDMLNLKLFSLKNQEYIGYCQVFHLIDDLKDLSTVL